MSLSDHDHSDVMDGDATLPESLERRYQIALRSLADSAPGAEAPPRQDPNQHHSLLPVGEDGEWPEAAGA